MATTSVAAPTEASRPAAPQQSQQKQQNQNRQGGKWAKGGKRPNSFQQGDWSKKKSRKRERDMKSGSHEEVLALDIEALRISQRSTTDDATADGAPVAEETLPEPGSEIEVEVVELSSTGDGLAQQDGSKQIYVVPFVVPGDRVKVKVYRHLKEGHTVADFVSVIRRSPLRDDSRINCKYFASCSGCQFQMLDYPEQLRRKRRIVEKAFRNFSQLPPELVPDILDTIGSPLQYGYRTKLTPHFDGPKGWSKKNAITGFESRPNIGFTPKTNPKTMDIEDCPIGTEAVRMGNKRERERMEREYKNYVRGGTILLRESTKRVPKAAESETSQPRSPSPPGEDVVKVETDRYTDYKTCVTDNNGTSIEYIDDYIFTNSAGSFFQNNNSILPVFTDHIRKHVLPPPATDGTTSSPIKYLIDAYSGSGLFTITLSSVFESSTGIDIDDKAIRFARRNAENNNLRPDQAKFISADAGELFKSVTYPADNTVVILDPPRKGCDASFLSQLLRFGPKRVVYVSCNVHTQARDVGILVRGEVAGTDAGSDAGSEAPQQGRKRVRYEIESLRGFDFFPQTGHVEGLALLNRVEEDNMPRVEAPVAVEPVST
jgi:tRNA (uracil-5-)-methyltransferase